MWWYDPKSGAVWQGPPQDAATIAMIQSQLGYVPINYYGSNPFDARRALAYQMGKFFYLDIYTARVTLRNPNPSAQLIDVVLFIRTIQWNALGVTIPAFGQLTIPFTVKMFDLGAGSHEIWVGVYLAGTTATLLYAQWPKNVEVLQV